MCSNRGSCIGMWLNLLLRATRIVNLCAGANETVLAAGWGLHKFKDGVPNLIPAPHGNEHVVCMLPKVGSTRYYLACRA